MNKNLLLKILAIISGLLIIAGLFLPYTERSLWAINMGENQIYLSIVIIVFALLPIILHTINKKTEFVYTSVGALGFFITVQLVDAITKGKFSAFGLGFYFILVGILLMGIVTVILGKSNKLNVLNEQIAPVSNNMADPVEMKNMDPTYGQSVDAPLSLENEVTDSIPEEPANNDEIVEALGEEIPEYQPENGVNPVISEFTTDANLPQESTETPVESSQEVTNVGNITPENNVIEQATTVEPAVEEVAAPAQPEVNPQPISDSPVAEAPVEEVASPVTEEVAPQPVSEQPVSLETVPQTDPVSEQPTIEETASQPINEQPTAPESDVKTPIFSTPQQSDILFEESQQQEIPQESQEPQVDIFGQPK